VEASVANILVVDDEPNIREVVGLYLRRDGHDVVSAADGEKALAVFRESEPDLVVLDLMLPKISGLEVCRRMRADRRVPLIMLTARGEEEERIVGLSLGADDYVVKPRRVAHRPEHARGPGAGRGCDADGQGVRPSVPAGLEPW
jgi:DNA-binding response OmpR family regulator